MNFALENILNLASLSGLEIILGIDNVIFIAILVQHLKPKKRNKLRFIGLSLALLLRIAMLFGASWVLHLTEPLFTISSFIFTGKAILLLVGGVFLIVKALLELLEMFNEVQVKEFNHIPTKEQNYFNIVLQIIFIDLILSFDSIITAIGMTQNLSIIIVAMVIAIIVMIAGADYVSNFIYRYPSIKVVALFFIALVGIMLIANGLNYEFPKTYIYIPMIFSLIVETVNILLSQKHHRIR